MLHLSYMNFVKNIPILNGLFQKYTRVTLELNGISQKYTYLTLELN